MHVFRVVPDLTIFTSSLLSVTWLLAAPRLKWRNSGDYSKFSAMVKFTPQIWCQLSMLSDICYLQNWIWVVTVQQRCCSTYISISSIHHWVSNSHPESSVSIPRLEAFGFLWFLGPVAPARCVKMTTSNPEFLQKKNMGWRWYDGYMWWWFLKLIGGRCYHNATMLLFHKAIEETLQPPLNGAHRETSHTKAINRVLSSHKTYRSLHESYKWAVCRPGFCLVFIPQQCKLYSYIGIWICKYSVHSIMLIVRLQYVELLLNIIIMLYRVHSHSQTSFIA